MSASASSLDPALLREMARYPLLDAAKERELAEAVRGGDAAARHRMACCNLRLVVSIAKFYAGRGVQFSDLVSEGFVGLMLAIDRYDPDRARFSTYATWWIKHKIRRAIKSGSSPVRIPEYVGRIVSEWEAAASAFEEATGRKPGVQEVLDLMDLDVHDDYVKAALLVSFSKTAPIDDPKWRDEIVDEGSGRIEASERDELVGFVEELDQRKRGVLRLYYFEGLTLREIGERFGVTKERVRQIKNEAIVELREKMVEGGVK